MKALSDVETATVAHKGDKYVAHTAFYADRRAQLPLHKGDVITIVDGPQGGWWLANSADAQGWIPSNYVSRATSEVLVQLTLEFEQAVGFAAVASETIERRRSSTVVLRKPQPNTPPPALGANIPKSENVHLGTGSGTSGKTTPKGTVTMTPPFSPRVGSSKISGAISRQISRTVDAAPAGLWSTGVRSELLDFLGKDEVNRQNAINELIKTERGYVDTLEVLTKVFMEPMKRKKLIDNRTAMRIFSNLEMILPIHTELLQTLEARRGDEKAVTEYIGDVFTNLVPYFKMYSLYVSNYPVAMETLVKLKSKPALEFLEACQKLPVCKGMHLNSLLLEPVQRLCRYPLLLREVYKNTDDSHADKAVLADSIMKTEATVSIVNEQKRNMECMAKTVELAEVLHAPHIVTLSRALLGQLKIDEVSTVKTKRQGSYIHFFNDGVMLSRSFKMSISSRSAKILLSPTKYECIKLRKIGKVKAPSGEVEYHIVIEAPYQSLKHKRTFACRTEQDYVQIETFFAEKGKGPPVKSDPSNSRNGTGSPKRPKKGSPTDSEVPKNNNPAPNINRRMAKVITRSEVAYSGDFSKAELSKLERTKSSPAGPTSGCRIVTSTGIAVDPDYIKISGCARDAADPFTFLYKIHIGKTANQYIYRSYDDFFAMHVQICAEYATLRSAESILPELIPPRTTLSEEAAMDLQQPLAQYLIDIINLPRLSNSLSIIESFLVSPSDVNPEARMAQNVQELPLAPFPWGQCGDNV